MICTLFSYYLCASFLCCGTLPMGHVFHLVCDHGLSLDGSRVQEWNLVVESMRGWIESASHVPVLPFHFHFLLPADKIPRRLGLLISRIGLFHGSPTPPKYPGNLSCFNKSFPFLEVEGELGLCPVNSVEGSPSLGCVLLLAKGSLLPTHTHGFELLGSDVLFQSSSRCDGHAQRALAPADGKSEVSCKQSTASVIGWQCSLSGKQVHRTSRVNHSRNLTLPLLQKWLSNFYRAMHMSEYLYNMLKL